FVGMAGVPRRYYENTAFPMFDELADVNVLVTVFAIVAGAAQLLFVYNFIHSIFYGKRTVQNPWKSNTLEWTAPIEHIHGNWEGEIPEVHRWAYDYSKTKENGEYIIAGQDFVPQHIPLQEDEEELNH
ncbi:MAG: cytochrome c oxidase subunit I, partial [Eudoraea sp.]|nr:cytochrome c oxidase subunit I [Eudoraea sp.]